jgi:transposase
MEIADDWILRASSRQRACTHTALSVREFMAEKCIHVLPQAPCSPDLSPCDLYLFPKLKYRVKGYHFQTFDGVQEGCNRRHQDPDRRLPNLLRGVENSLGQMFCIRGMLF